MTNGLPYPKVRSPRFGLRGLVLVLPVLVAFVLLNVQLRFPDSEPKLETHTVSVEASFGENAQYGWPISCVVVHYRMRPDLDLDIGGFGSAHYQIQWLPLLSNVVAFVIATLLLCAMSSLSSRQIRQRIANSRRGQ